MLKYFFSLIMFSLIGMLVVQAEEGLQSPRRIRIAVDSIWGQERTKFQKFISENSSIGDLELLSSRVARSPQGPASYEVELSSEAYQVARFLVATTQIAPIAHFKLIPGLQSFHSQEFEIVDINPSKFMEVLVAFLRTGILPTSISEGVISFDALMHSSSAILLRDLKAQGLKVVNKNDQSPANVKSGYIYAFTVSLPDVSIADAFTKKLISKYRDFEFMKSAREGKFIVLTYRLVLNPQQIDPEKESNRILRNLKKWKNVKSVAANLLGRANVIVARPDVTIPGPDVTRPNSGVGALPPREFGPRRPMPVKPTPAAPDSINEERVLTIALSEIELPYQVIVEQVRSVPGLKIINDHKSKRFIFVEVEEAFDIKEVKSQLEKLNSVAAVSYNIQASIPSQGMGALPPREFGPRRPMPVDPNEGMEERILLVSLSDASLTYAEKLEQVRSIEGVRVINELKALGIVVVAVDAKFDVEAVQKQLESLSAVNSVARSEKVTIPTPIPGQPKSKFDVLVGEQKASGVAEPGVGVPKDGFLNNIRKHLEGTSAAVVQPAIVPFDESRALTVYKADGFKSEDLRQLMLAQEFVERLGAQFTDRIIVQVKSGQDLEKAAEYLRSLNVIKSVTVGGTNALPGVFDAQATSQKKVSITIRPKQRGDAEAILKQLKTMPGILTGEVVGFRSFNIVLVEVDATFADQVLNTIKSDARVLRANRSPERQLVSSVGDTQSQVSVLDIARTNEETAGILAEITCRQFFSR